DLERPDRLDDAYLPYPEGFEIEKRPKEIQKAAADEDGECRSLQKGWVEQALPDKGKEDERAEEGYGEQSLAIAHLAGRSLYEEVSEAPAEHGDEGESYPDAYSDHVR